MLEATLYLNFFSAAPKPLEAWPLFATGKLREGSSTFFEPVIADQFRCLSDCDVPDSMILIFHASLRYRPPGGNQSLTAFLLKHHWLIDGARISNLLTGSVSPSRNNVPFMGGPLFHREI